LSVPESITSRSNASSSAPRSRPVWSASEGRAILSAITIEPPPLA
jgi:hypothetical protein